MENSKKKTKKALNLNEAGKRIVELEDKLERLQRQMGAEQRQLIQADKMVALGLLVSGVAHEINNPNHIIGINAPIIWEAWQSIEPILEEYSREHGDFSMGGFSYSDMTEMASMLFSGIVESSNRIKTIVKELRDFARFHPATMTQSVDVNNVVKSAVKLMSAMIGRSTMNFKIVYGLDVPKIIGDPDLIKQVVIRLIQNSCQALSNSNQGIFVRTYFDEENDSVGVSVQDEGQGIEQELLSKVFLPFFTTRSEDGGVGLGLSIAARIVEDHGGILAIDSSPGDGTTVSFSISRTHEVEQAEGDDQ